MDRQETDRFIESLTKRDYVRSSKLRESARGAPCLVRSPNCNNDPSTSVLAHLDSSSHGKGTGIKADDSAAAISCSDCHDYVALNTRIPQKEREMLHLHGVVRTYGYWIAKGILLIA